MRKRPWRFRVGIDLQTFALELTRDAWHTIALERLSAGERQLLAMAILWALARCSRCPAPTVIDSPLGRLDSVHRGNLLERYFPRASQQVILLSTDTEIDAEAYRQLEPAHTLETGNEGRRFKKSGLIPQDAGPRRLRHMESYATSGQLTSFQRGP